MKKVVAVIIVFYVLGFAHAASHAQIHFTARLNGAQENPPVTTTATGTGTFTLNSGGTELNYHITFTGLSSAFRFAHFHNAATGTNGGVVRDIAFNGNTASGTWKADDASQPLTPNLVKELLSGNLYVNVHSVNFGGGEIRGQVLVDYGIGLSAKLDGSQEVPAVNTTATGTGSFLLKSSSSGTVTELEYQITVDGLSSNLAAAHFHNAAAGANGGVVRDISFNGNTASGSWKSDDTNQPLTPALLTELLAGRLYVNVHTTNFGGGEIRGQVLVTTGIGFTAQLDGAQEAPPVNTTARGTGSFTLNNDGTALTYDITVAGLSGPVTNAHFHNAAPGVSGGVVRNITYYGKTASGVWKSTDASQPLTPTLLNELLNGNIYANFHTAANPGGEIRGQLKINYGISFTARLTGLQEAPNPVLTRATGTGAFTLADGGNEMNYQITYTDLSSSFTASHFHNAEAGASAGVVRNISFSGNNTTAESWKSSDASQPLSPTLLVELLAGRLYVNIHSSSNAGGEIRGQVLRDANTLPAVSIGLARTVLDSTQNVTMEGVITTVDFQLSSTSNSEFYFQDASGGMRLFARGKLTSPPGTLIRVNNGLVYTFDGRKNVEVQGNLIEELGTPGLPAPKIVTINEYKTNQAATEGQYIGIIRASLKSGAWPTANNNATVYLADASTGSADSLAMFLDRDTDIDGSPEPASPFDVLGVATQFRGVPQIQPSARADFRPAGALPVELVDFRATAIGTNIELTWRTASETDNYGFEIERKAAAGDFKRIGFVAGHGTTTQAQSYRFVDNQLALGTYYYRLKQIDLDGTFTYSTVIEAVASIAPETFELRQNHPNPFNPATTIEFVLGRTQPARLAVYNILGREVAVLFNGQAEAGKLYQLAFDGAQQASGIYFYRLESGERTVIKKMLLSK